MPEPRGNHEETVDAVARTVERYNLADYLELTNRPWRLIWINLLAGAARGVGVTIGFSLLSALLLYLLQRLMLSRLPYVSNFIADLVHLVKLDLKMRP